MSDCDSNLSHCNFINAEFTHDFNKYFNYNKRSDPLYRTIIAKNLEQYCPVTPTTRRGVLDYCLPQNDETIVKKVTRNSPFPTGDIKNTIKNQPEKIENPMQINTINIFNLSRPIKTNCYFKNVKNWRKNTTVPIVNTYNIFNVLTGIPRNPNEFLADVFLFVDTGIHLVSHLKTEPNTKNITINVMNTFFSLADSANKGDPTGAGLYKPYTTTGLNINNWMYEAEQVTPDNDAVLMLAYRIRSDYVTVPATNIVQGGFKLIAKQQWYKSTDTGGIRMNTAMPPIPNPKVYNNVGQVAAAVNSTKNLASDIGKSYAGYHFSRKRSGDYAQIYITKKFPQLITRDRTIPIKKCCNVYNSARDSIPLYKLYDKPYQDYAWFKRRTFFITGDWPAFMYSIYNQINTIYWEKNVILIRAHFV